MTCFRGKKWSRKKIYFFHYFRLNVISPRSMFDYKSISHEGIRWKMLSLPMMINRSHELPSVSHLRWKHNRIEYPLVSTSSTFSRQPTSLNYISIIYHGITTKCVKAFNTILSTALIITETEMYLKDLLSLDFKCSAKYTTDLKCQIIFLDNNHGIVNMTTKIQPQQHQQQQQKLQ